jgi:hypothetical protein
MSPTVFTYSAPIIDYMTMGIKFCSPCIYSCTFVFKSRVISIDKQNDEILIFLIDNQIVQLTDLQNTNETYNAIIAWLS